MKTLKHKPDLFQYLKRGWQYWNLPIADVDDDGKCPYPEGYTVYDREFEKIESDFRKYSDNLQIIKFYIEQHPWILFYLYWDDTSQKEIESLWMSIKTASDGITQGVRVFIDRVLDIINKSIEKEGGILSYLKKRYEVHRTNYHRQQEQNADFDDDEEGHILDFLYSLVYEINKTQWIEGDSSEIFPDFFIGIGCIHGKEQELKLYFEKLKVTQSLSFDNLNLVTENNKIGVKGDANKNVLAFFEYLERDGLIKNITGNYSGKGPLKVHTDRITKYFQRMDAHGKVGDFDHQSLTNMRSSKKYKTTQNRFDVTKSSIPAPQKK